MKAPRTAHWPILAPMLALGMALGPAWAHAAPAKPPAGNAEAAPKEDGGGAEGEPAPKTEPGGVSKGGTAAKGKTARLDVGAPIEAEPEDSEASPEADAGASPDAGTADAPDADATSPEAEPTEPAAAEAAPEAPLEPEITVQPRPVEPGLETSTAASGVASREAVTDPRRLRSDDRILFRAGILSLGVAAAAVVPTVIGFQQAYVAHEDDDPARERTMRGLGIGAGVAAGTYAITGAVLLALGARQRRAALAPAVGPGQVVLVLRARF